MDSGTRAGLLARLADAVRSVAVAHPVRVAIDGAPAAGKTTLADELAVVLRAQGRDIIRATIDDFLVPTDQRYRRGEYSGAGCYFDAHDHDALNRVLLDPLGPGGDRRWRPSAPERAAASASTSPPMTAPVDAVLLFDGVFLLRPELLARWDLRIFVSATPQTTLGRAVLRERHRSSPTDVRRRWRERYIPAQELYSAAVGPADRADVIVYNEDPTHPSWQTAGQ